MENGTLKPAKKKVRQSFNPQTGHKQKGRRLALVGSNKIFNTFMRTVAMICPITNTDKHLPMQVRLDTRTKTADVIMCEQLKMLDIDMREAKFIEKTPNNIVQEALDIISCFIEMAQNALMSFKT